MHFRDSMIDSLIPGPHTLFKEISRRVLGYRLEQIGLDVPDEDVCRVIRQWKTLKPYPDVDAALDRLSDEYEGLRATILLFRVCLPAVLDLASRRSTCAGRVDR